MDNWSATVLKSDGKRAPLKGGLEAKQEAEIEPLRAVVAESTAENRRTLLKEKVLASTILRVCWRRRRRR